MTDEQLAEWERLAAAATPGPWEAIPTVDADFATIKTRGKLGWMQYHEYDPGIDATDAAFVAAAREAVPALVAEVRRLREALRAVERVVDGDGDASRAAIADIVGPALYPGA